MEPRKTGGARRWRADRAALLRDLLGLEEVPKPEPLAARGGCWFCAFDEQGMISAEVHLGVDQSQPPAEAHTAFLLSDHEELEQLAEALDAAGFDVDYTERHSFEGYERFHLRDPFGNRLEMLTPR